MRFAIATILAGLTSAAMAQPTPQAAGVTEFMGPAISVTSLEKSLAFYRDGLGMKVRGDFGGGPVLETMLVSEGHPEAPMLILLSKKAPGDQPALIHGNGFHRLVMRVSSIGAVVARLRDKGFMVSNVRATAGLYCMAMATDPDGYKIEMVEKQTKQGGCNGV